MGALVDLNDGLRQIKINEVEFIVDGVSYHIHNILLTQKYHNSDSYILDYDYVEDWNGNEAPKYMDEDYIKDEVYIYCLKHSLFSLEEEII